MGRGWASPRIVFGPSIAHALPFTYSPRFIHGGTCGPIRKNHVRGSLPELDHALWLSNTGSTRHVELTPSEVSPVRDRWHRGGVWNDLCRRAGLGRDAEATVKCGHEPKDDGNHGCLSGSMGLLRLVDSFATGDRMEYGRGVDQFPKRRRVPAFCPQGKKASNNVSK
jgi:hypothetical protein